MKQYYIKIRSPFSSRMLLSQNFKSQAQIIILLTFLFISIFDIQAQLVERNKLIGAGSIGISAQGEDVSISHDGNIAIVGGQYDNGGTGAAWIFEKNSSGNWVQESPKLVGTGAIGNARQGYSVDISGNGMYAIIGGPNDNGGVGAIWFFERINSTTWTEVGKYVGIVLSTERPRQGHDVSINYDGTIAIESGPDYNRLLTPGAVWTFARTSAVWAQIGTLIPGSITGYEEVFGFSISLSADGNSAIIGRNGSDIDGRALLLTGNGGVWTSGVELYSFSNANSGISQYFGRSVEISADGNTVIIGAPQYTGNGKSITGGAFVFKKYGGVWDYPIVIVGTEVFGESVSVSGDGNLVMLGGNFGGSFIYKRTAGIWSQEGSMLVGSGALGNALQGASVSLSAYSCKALMGGPGDNSNIGATWLFTCDTPLPVELTSFVSNVSGSDVQLYWSTSSETNNSGFDIERSAVYGEWSKVNFVQGNGTTSIPNNYEFTDKNLSSGKYNYRLKQIDFNGSFEYFNLSNEVEIGTPDKFSLSQNFPNPFNPSTKISYSMPFDGKVSLKVLDISGKEVMNLKNEIKSAGYYEETISGSSLSSGVYFYRLSVVGDGQNFVATKKMVLIK